MRIAVLRNPLSTGNRNRPPPEMPEGVRLIVPEGFAALDRDLRSLAVEGVDLLVVDAGDGTVREVVSRLPEIFAMPPSLGIIANGNTNLVARKLGRISSLAKLAPLASLPADRLAAMTRERPVLRIDGLLDRPVRGFIAGWGAYAAGTRIAVEEISARGGRQVMRAVLATIRRAFAGRDAAALREGVEGSCAPDGTGLVEGRRFLGVATVLEGSLVVGIQPFWGGGTGVIRWLDIAAPPRRLMLAVLPAMFGRPMGWMMRAGYRSGRSDRILLKISGGLVVDGEIVPTDPAKALTFTAKERLRVVTI